MIPYYHDDLAGITIYQGDCLEVMPALQEKSIDAIITDIPYGTTACSWDQVIPFVDMWREIKRLVKPRGAVVLFGSQPFTSLLIASNLDWFKYEWIWRKNVPTDFLNAKNKPMKIHENIAVFSQGTTANGSENKMNYYPQPRKGKGYRVSSPNDKRIGVIDKGNRTPFLPTMSESDGSNYYPVSTVDFDTDKCFANPNPTSKPLDLMQYLIRTYTNPGDTVLDFTMGSGTTLEAAKLEGRKAIGIERDTGKNGECLGYCDYAVQRLSQGVLQLF